MGKYGNGEFFYVVRNYIVMFMYSGYCLGSLILK